MNRKKSLIQELSRLLHDYPPEEWEALQKLIVSEGVKAIINDVAPVARKAKPPRNKVGTEFPTRGIPKSLIGLEDEKRHLLISVRNALRAKELSPTLADLRHFAEVVGIKDRLAVKRNQAVDEIVTFLAEKDLADIHRSVEEAAKERSDLGEEYFRWVDHILGR